MVESFVLDPVATGMTKGGQFLFLVDQVCNDTAKKQKLSPRAENGAADEVEKQEVKSTWFILLYIVIIGIVIVWTITIISMIVSKVRHRNDGHKPIWY